MSSTVHQSFQVGLESKQYEQGLARMETQTRTSSARVTRELGGIDRSFARSAGFSRIGQVSMQLQDVAVQLQMGASAGRVLAQQGSQIASIFGPGGAIVGGLIAMTALLWESVRGAKALKQEAKEKVAIDRINAQTQENRKAIDQVKGDQFATKVAQTRKGLADDEADAAERRLRFEEKIKEIQDNPRLSKGFKSAAIEAAEDRFRAEDSERFARKKLASGNQRVRDIGQETLDRAAEIRGDAPSRADAARRDREVARSERRALAEEMDRIDREARNDLPSRRSKIEKPGPTGLSPRERDLARSARESALDAAKKGKDTVLIDQESVDKILNGIDNLRMR